MLVASLTPLRLRAVALSSLRVPRIPSTARYSQEHSKPPWNDAGLKFSKPHWNDVGLKFSKIRQSDVGLKFSKLPRGEFGLKFSRPPRNDIGLEFSRPPRNDAGLKFSKPHWNDVKFSKSPRNDIGLKFLKSRRNDVGLEFSEPPWEEVAPRLSAKDRRKAFDRVNERMAHLEIDLWEEEQGVSKGRKKPPKPLARPRQRVADLISQRLAPGPDPNPEESPETDRKSILLQYYLDTYTEDIHSRVKAVMGVNEDLQRMVRPFARWRHRYATSPPGTVKLSALDKWFAHIRKSTRQFKCYRIWFLDYQAMKDLAYIINFINPKLLEGVSRKALRVRLFNAMVQMKKTRSPRSIQELIEARASLFEIANDLRRLEIATRDPDSESYTKKWERKLSRYDNSGITPVPPPNPAIFPLPKPFRMLSPILRAVENNLLIAEVLCVELLMRKTLLEVPVIMKNARHIFRKAGYEFPFVYSPFVEEDIERAIEFVDSLPVELLGFTDLLPGKLDIEHGLEFTAPPPTNLDIEHGLEFIDSPLHGLEFTDLLPGELDTEHGLVFTELPFVEPDIMPSAPLPPTRPSSIPHTRLGPRRKDKRRDSGNRPNGSHILTAWTPTVRRSAEDRDSRSRSHSYPDMSSW
ncbi:hypothetical protein F5X98DRAFT_112371 [Xylaria grammica]|nr:hypothetical protein F5X98DRAFT_112371 [Xylaria grammica]